jgi:RHS repeat-associated protein
MAFFNNYYYTRDHEGSVRELVDGSGSIVSRMAYDPYGRTTTVSGTILPTMQYAGYYEHQTSVLALTKYRAYDSNTGRWLSRDPISERGGLNIYGYVDNQPSDLSDHFGLDYKLPGNGNGTPGLNLPGGASRGSYEDWMSGGNGMGGGLLSPGDSVNMDRGCIGLCSVRQGQNQQFPENAPNTTCYSDFARAMKQECPGGGRKFVFAKQGQWNGSQPDPNKITGSVPNNSISSAGGDYNYSSYAPDSGYWEWMNHKKMSDPQRVYTSTQLPDDPEYPHTIYCVTCCPQQ